MVDRQDIDALLISALYGELTPADEARLTAHLESHPADKSALADLTQTRNTLRESRFLTVQLEPPQAVSAMLLQEATRQRKVVAVAIDPPKEGWFQRFVRSFAAHPAMAAAAMLVIVVGVAGTMWLRKGDSMMAEQSAPASDRSIAAGAAAPEPVSEAEELRRNAGSGYNAQLAESGPATDSDKKSAELARDEGIAGKGEAAKADAKVAAKPRTTYLVPESPKYAPKDLEFAPRGGDVAKEDSNAGRGGVAQRRPDVIIADGKSPAPAPQADPSTTTAIPPPATTKPGAKSGTGSTVARGNNAPTTGADDTQLKDKDKVDTETQWARDQHAKVTVAVRANNCREAATLALQLSTRAPAYYNSNVETDRQLKQCMTYITAEREKEVERVQRARALEKRRTEEPRATKPATTDSKK